MPTPAEERAKYTDHILQSRARRKLIVAGPGTGKTFTFREALKMAGGGGLALTFINNLARDLEMELTGVADSYTFHGFCKHLLHRICVDGLTSNFQYYPPLLLILAQDMEFLGRTGVDDREIERCLHNLDDTQGTISESLRLASYYDAVGHTDAVYRVLRHLENNQNDIPTYPLVVVDEYQDFSLLETTFIRLLAERSPVLIAGDDDQALYGFKHASANYIRALAQDAGYSKFELPYCSRCTEVIVNAVHDVLDGARPRGLLSGRLDKPFLYYSPDKGKDSRAHPSIIHAHCTVENNRAPYIGRYVATRIAEIPEDESRESSEGRYPTALVIGPVQFVRRVYPVIKARFPNAILKESSPLEVSILDGYRYLLEDEESRLGWRIILFCDPADNTREILARCFRSHIELHSLVRADFRTRHLRVARIVEKVLGAESLSAVEKELLESTVAQSLETIEGVLRRNVEESGTEVSTEDPDTLAPSVICTSLRGAKGLSANRVFIVGFNNGHFPRDPAAVTDDEVCSLLVGLSRTRRQCYVVSCGRFGNAPLRQSVFVDWIRARLAFERVDRTWIQANATSSA